MRVRVFLLSFLAVAVLAANGYGATDNWERNRKGELFNVRLYHEETKSYFELRRHSGSWLKAYRAARAGVFKGTRGRLAMLKTKEANDFVVQNFRPPDGTWLGMRYFCKKRKFVWIDGTSLKKSDYHNFGARWFDPNAYPPCRGNRREYGAIEFREYLGEIRWWGMSPTHAQGAYLVEYPTGER